MSRPSASELSLSTLPKVVCALDLETSGPNALKPDRTDLAVVGLEVYTWDEQQTGERGASNGCTTLGGGRLETSLKG